MGTVGSNPTVSAIAASLVSASRGPTPRLSSASGTDTLLGWTARCSTS